MRWFRALFGWRSVGQTGVWDYQQNAATGKRRAVRINRGGHQPQDHIWLANLTDRPPGTWAAAKARARVEMLKQARPAIQPQA